MSTYEEQPGDATPQLRLLTPETARAQSQQNERGWVFTLHHTTDADGNPQQIIVRKVSLADRATLAHLPAVLQNRFLSIVNDQTDRAPQERLTKERMLDNAESRVELANLYLCAGAINPRVYLTPGEAPRFSGVFVGDINLADRMAFQTACEGSTRDAAQRFRPYRGQPEDYVDVGSSMQTVSEEVPVTIGSAWSDGPAR
jgi:hypothetical protein